MTRLLRLGVVACLLQAAPGLLPAQQTAADSAQVLLEAARLLEAQGQPRLARELLRHLLDRYPGTPAALAAREAERQLAAAPVTGLGRTGFIVWNTIYGGFLGVAVPAAFGAEGPEPYGAGLLIGAPLGFFASNAYARSNPPTDGQAGLINFGSFWGTWQGFGWQAVLEIGDKEICDPGGFCYLDESDTAPWALAVGGGLAGLGVGLLAAQGPVPGGTSSLVFNSALWATWYGVAAGVVTGQADDDLLAATLIGGDVGVLAAIPLAKWWRPSAARVRIASAGGIAGGLAGLGVALLVNADDEKTVVAIVSAGVTAGLIAGAALAKDRDLRAAAGFAPALLTLRDGLRLGLPAPMPAAIPMETRGGERRMVPGVRVVLFEGGRGR